MAKHFTLAQRKALIGRLSALQSFDALGGYDKESRLAVIRDTMLQRSAEALDPERNAEPLDRWFQEQTRYICENLPGLSTLPATSAMQDMADALAKRSAEVSCPSCAGGKICNGSLTDDAIVAEGGICIAPLRTIFAEARRIAAAYYEVFAGVKPVDVSLFTGLPKKQGSWSDDLRVNGEARLSDTQQGPWSEVDLLLDVQGFTWDDYLACLYVLLHECVCHAFAGLRTTKARPKLADYDAFAEGWMDWVVSMLLDDLKQGTALASKETAAKLPQLEEMCRVGSTYHTARVRPPRAPASVVRAVRAVTNTYSFLKSRYDPGVARDMIYRLSFVLNSLNLNEFTVKKKMEVCRTIADHLKPEVEYYHPGRAKVEGALTRYAKHQDCRRLVRELS